MGNDNQKEYDRNESIKKLEKKSEKLEKDIDEMWKDPMFSFEECIHAQTAKEIMDDQVKSLNEMNESEKKFSKINLDEYRNKNGNFDVYEVKRPLNISSSRQSSTMSSKFFHEGFAFGNEQKKIFTDYGVGEGNSAIRFWDSSENKDNFIKMTKVGESTLSNNKVKDSLFGKKSENWSSPNSYSIIGHNCQDYAKQIKKEFLKDKA